MYDIPSFKEKDREVVLRFMREHPFIYLSGCNSSNKPVATQLPVFMDEVDGRIVLTGHIMRNSDHHKAFVENNNVLAVFTGPHVYVSATWYDNPNQASTWNYISVHAKGTIRFGDQQALIDVLKRLTLYYENGNAQSTTVFDNLPVDYREGLMKGIVAFEIEVTHLEHIFKLSQNRDEKTYDNIIQHLKDQPGDGAEIARIMEERKSKVFSS